MKTTEIDFDANYRVKGFPAVAFYLLGFATETVTVDIEVGEDEWVQDFEEVEDTDNVRAVMVGDDKIHIVSVDDLIKIEEDQFCQSCGQIGCGH